MKKNKIIFWATSGVIAAMMLMSAGMYLSKSQQLVDGFKFMGYPQYMLYILGTAKLLSVFGLLQPWSLKLREWTYAGLTFTFIGAIWSHLATSTPFAMPLIFLAILWVSWAFNRKMQSATV
ncbi:MAG: DoxX family protein [Taibaiella sp.]|nr:DoxX family protein [Taibaiella sp.]